MKRFLAGLHRHRTVQPWVAARMEARALVITTIYAVLATLWILFSDQVLWALADDPQRLVTLGLF